MVHECCFFGPKIWPPQKGVGEIREDCFLTYFDHPSSNLALVFHKNFMGMLCQICRLCLSTTVAAGLYECYDNSGWK